MSLSGVLDLRQLHFVTPGGVVLLFYGILQAINHRVSAVLRLGKGQVRQYLARIGFFRALPSTVTIEPALSEEERFSETAYLGDCPTLLEFNEFSTFDEVRAIVDKVRRTAVDELDYSMKEAKKIAILFSEIAHNAVEHGGEVQAVALMQVYRNASKPRLEFVIGDNGMGIQRSLSTNPLYHHLDSDKAAIAESVLVEVSRTKDKTAGNGLAHVMREIKHQGGMVDIRSGAGKLHHRGNAKHSHTLDVPNVSGTQVILSLATAA